MEKLDLKKEHKGLYCGKVDRFELVDAPVCNYLSIDGMGDPATSAAFKEGVRALFAAAQALNQLAVQEDWGPRFVCMPLETLWWADDPDVFALGQKDMWQWTLMVMVPQFVAREHFERALLELRKKKNCPSLTDITMESFREGPSAQTLFVGHHTTEFPTIIKLHDFIEQSGFSLRGKHHEIYLSDPRRTPPEKRRVIIRQPYHQL